MSLESPLEVNDHEKQRDTCVFHSVFFSRELGIEKASIEFIHGWGLTGVDVTYR